MAQIRRKAIVSRSREFLKTLLTFSSGVIVAAICFTIREGEQCTIDRWLSSSLTTTNVSSEQQSVIVKSTGGLDGRKALTADASDVNNGHDQAVVDDFFTIGKLTGTDKIRGAAQFDTCRHDITKCAFPNAVNPKCRVSGHFYHTFYNRWLQPYSRAQDENVDPFLFLEIGFFRGSGYDAYTRFLSDKAEAHSIEISCLEEGPRSEGKWPWGNFASNNPRYQALLDSNLLHCGDASEYDFLYALWTEHLKRDIPLKVVIDDASHHSDHMAASIFFWFPRIAPGGLLIIEDIQPQNDMNTFRLHLLPKLLKDMHYCGGGTDYNRKDEKLCFPTIQPLLQSVHCEMHICVLERNDQLPTGDSLTREQSLAPVDALKAGGCLFD